MRLLRFFKEAESKVCRTNDLKVILEGLHPLENAWMISS